MKTEVGHSKYKVAAGKSGTISVGLLTDGKHLIAGAKKHTIKVTETITVSRRARPSKSKVDPGRLGHCLMPRVAGPRSATRGPACRRRDDNDGATATDYDGTKDDGTMMTGRR